jgi:hypothetical protein
LNCEPNFMRLRERGFNQYRAETTKGYTEYTNAATRN